MTWLRAIADGWLRYRPSKKIALPACIASFLLSIPVGFLTGGWTTGSRAREMAKLAYEAGQADIAARICMDRFLSAPGATARLGALPRQASRYRGALLKAQGWTALHGLPNLPGHKEPVSGEADLCAQRLLGAQPGIASTRHQNEQSGGTAARASSLSG